MKFVACHGALSMPVLVSTTAWDTAARLGELVQAKRVSPRMRGPWYKVHRLVVSGGRLRLQSTDARIFLAWTLSAEMDRPEQEFDVLVQAQHVGAVAGCEEADGCLEIEHDHAWNLLAVRQVRRPFMLLRIEADPTVNYPEPLDELSNRAQDTDERRPDRPRTARWSIDARALSKSLEFVSTLVERRRIGAETSFVTHLPDGRVVGGTPRAFAMVEGLPEPPTAMIYRRPSVDVLAAFLARLGDEAKVEISERSYRFTCPSMGHELHLPRECDVPPPWPQMDDEEHEEILIEGPQFKQAVLLAGVFLTEPAVRLNVLIRGDGGNSSLLISTPLLNYAGRSGLETLRTVPPSIRASGEEGEAPDTRFSLVADHLNAALRKMTGAVLRLRYDRRQALLRIDDEAEEFGKTRRSAILSIHEEFGPVWE